LHAEEGVGFLEEEEEMRVKQDTGTSVIFGYKV
jgi:hypothetical protein